MRPRRRRSRELFPFEASARGLGEILSIAASEHRDRCVIVAEHRFHERRRWEFDFAAPDLMLAFEYEGGIFSHQGHTRPDRYRSDMEKYNEAALAGWLVLRFGPDETRTGTALNWIERAIAARLKVKLEVKLEVNS